MPLITIFSAPKPFDDPFIATIQRNAIQSWLALGPQATVLLIGEEPGLAEAAEEFGVKHISGIEQNEWGTPTVRSIFARARQASDSQLMALVNTDILLFPDFLQAARAVSELRGCFLVVGRRWGLNLNERLDFSPGWESRIRQRVKASGSLHPIFSIDYFVFRRQQYEEMPEFVIGRPQWDNWMIYHAKQRGWLVVDATPSVLAVHQNHDYRHLPGGKPPHGSEEGRRNRELAGGVQSRYLIIDADKELVAGKLRDPGLSLERLLRRVELRLMSKMERPLARRLLRLFRRWRRAAGDPLPSDGMHWGAKARQRELE